MKKNHSVSPEDVLDTYMDREVVQDLVDDDMLPFVIPDGAVYSLMAFFLLFVISLWMFL